MNALLDKAIELPVSERIQFVEDVWDSIAIDSGAVELSTEQRAELKRRVDEFRQDPSGNVPWEDIKAQALVRK